MSKRDISILRELAKSVSEIASKDIQNERRELWRGQNSFERVCPPVYIFGGYEEEIIRPILECTDPFYKEFEMGLRARILQDTFDDDTIIEPWITMTATHVLPEDGAWGVDYTTDRLAGSMALHINAALESFNDMKKMIIPTHRIDEKQTAENFEKINDAVGDILEVYVKRSPYWEHWAGDISTHLGNLRGHEQMLYDMVESPDELHELLTFMSNGVLKAHEEAEKAGDWTLADHNNQSMTYSRTLSDPKPNVVANRDELWGYFAAQEFAVVSPAMHDEFLLQYQLPIMEKFGLISYGCCEDLSRKIEILRKIKNLRRFAITPFADVKMCAEQIGTEYVCSYRPHPNLLQGEYSEDDIEKVLKNSMELFRQNKCYVDICMKDITTVGGDPSRLKRFVEIARKVTGA